MAFPLLSRSFLAVARRGYATAASMEVGKKGRVLEEKMAVVGAGKGEAGASSAFSASWVPDPVTGCYKPANRMGEVDAADLRAMLLSRKA